MPASKTDRFCGWTFSVTYIVVYMVCMHCLKNTQERFLTGSIIERIYECRRSQHRLLGLCILKDIVFASTVGGHAYAHTFLVIAP